MECMALHIEDCNVSGCMQPHTVACKHHKVYPGDRCQSSGGCNLGMAGRNSGCIYHGHFQAFSCRGRTCTCLPTISYSSTVSAMKNLQEWPHFKVPAQFAVHTYSSASTSSWQRTITACSHFGTVRRTVTIHSMLSWA